MRSLSLSLSLSSLSFYVAYFSPFSCLQVPPFCTLLCLTRVFSPFPPSDMYTAYTAILDHDEGWRENGQFATLFKKGRPRPTRRDCTICVRPRLWHTLREEGNSYANFYEDSKSPRGDAAFEIPPRPASNKRVRATEKYGTFPCIQHSICGLVHSNFNIPFFFVLSWLGGWA